MVRLAESAGKPADVLTRTDLMHLCKVVMIKMVDVGVLSNPGYHPSNNHPLSVKVVGRVNINLQFRTMAGKWYLLEMSRAGSGNPYHASRVHGDQRRQLREISAARRIGIHRLCFLGSPSRRMSMKSCSSRVSILLDHLAVTTCLICSTVLLLGGEACFW